MLSSCVAYPHFSERDISEQCGVFTKKLELGFFNAGIRITSTKAEREELKSNLKGLN